jgi:hypothetical protein
MLRTRATRLDRSVTDSKSADEQARSNEGTPTTTPPDAVEVSLIGQTLVTVTIETATAERSAAVRAANDRICASAVRLKFEDDQRVPFVCECANARCLGTVMLTLAAYARLHQERRRFVLLPGHENAAEERVTEDRRDLGYVVVERLADPRGGIRD